MKRWAREPLKGVEPHPAAVKSLEEKRAQLKWRPRRGFLTDQPVEKKVEPELDEGKVSYLLMRQGT